MKKGRLIAVFLVFLMVLGVGPAFAAKGGSPGPPDGKGGGGGNGPGSGGGDKKGALYGDLYVIVRDALGIPILYDWSGGQPVIDMEMGFFQPIAADGSLIPINEEGEVVVGYEYLTQEIELGRLNLGRSPLDTLKAAFAETCKNVALADEVYLDVAGRLVLLTYADTGDAVVKTIDSPRENLALYQQLMIDGHLSNYNMPIIDYPEMNIMSRPDDGADPVFAFKADARIDPRLAPLTDGRLSYDDLDLAASFLGAASDKYGRITIDMVIYLNAIIGVNNSGIGGPGYFLPLNSARYHLKFFNFTGYTYSRQTTYPGDITYIQSNGDGTYSDVTAPIMTAVFGNIDYSGGSGTPVKNFAQAADDARAIIAFTHEIVQDVVTEIQINKMR